MLTCHGCMRHCLQTIIGDSAFLTASSRPAFTSNINRLPLRRTYTGTSYERSQAGRENNRGRFDGRDADLEIRRTEKGKPRDVSPRLANRRQWLDSRGIRPTSNKAIRLERTELQVKQHLRYLNDPLKLADFVRQNLRNDDAFEFALELVRTASKNALHVVSWNHLIEWLMSKGRMNAAIGTYNEMKKRAQIPNAQTYTIIFKGCSEHKESNFALAKVLTIYHTMFTDKSPVKPNTIHMNCVLRMCSRARDMDALFSVASQFNNHGLQAPNNLSFTIILNAIRMNAAGGARSSLSPMAKRKGQRDAIASSREIWVDIVSRWRKGDIWIDEELVASMGRLLLIGQEQDWDDIFSLIEQTMNIPRQVPKLGTPARQKIDPASQGQVEFADNSSAEWKAVQDKLSAKAQDGVETEDQAVVPRFDPITVPVTKTDGLAMYAKPGPNTLSLLLQATLNLRMKAPGTAYWNIFTKSLLVAPDRENYHAYLRILRMARASTETVDLLLEMPKQDMEIKTFRISLSTCARDKRNRNVFKSASKIIDLMQMSLRQPDIQALEYYLEVAITSPAYDTPNQQASSKQAQGKQILRALDRLNPSFLNLKSAMQFGNSSDESRSTFAQDQLIQEILGLTRRMVGAYDLLMNNAMVPRDMYLDLTKQRSKLSAFIGRYNLQKIRGFARSPTVISEKATDLHGNNTEANGFKTHNEAPPDQLQQEHVPFRTRHAGNYANF